MPRNAAPGLRWNQGGWFGAQVGTTLWLFVLALAELRADLVVAGAALLIGIALNAYGAWLWTRRGVLRAHGAMQRFLAAASLGVLAVVLVQRARGAADELSPWILAAMPAMMLFFLVHERAACAQALPPTENGTPPAA